MVVQIWLSNFSVQKCVSRKNKTDFLQTPYKNSLLGAVSDVIIVCNSKTDESPNLIGQF